MIFINCIITRSIINSGIAIIITCGYITTSSNTTFKTITNEYSKIFPLPNCRTNFFDETNAYVLYFKDLEWNGYPNFDRKPKFSINLKINDFSDWDSLGNFNLLLNVEEFYNFRFTSYAPSS